MKLLSDRDKKLIFLVILTTVFLSLLDLIGVMFIGVLGSLAANGISANQTGNRVMAVLNFLGIETLSLQSQVSILGALGASVLILKTLLSLLFTRKSLYFLARRSAMISSELIAKYFTMPLSHINRRSSQESIYALTAGVNFVMVGIIGTWITMIADVSVLLVLGIGLAYVDIFTAIGALCIFSSVALLLHYRTYKKVKAIGETQSELNVQGSQNIAEAIYAYRELTVWGRRGFYAQKISKNRFDLADGTASIAFMQNISKYVLELTLVSSSLLLAAYQFTSTSAVRAITVIVIFVAASTRITPAILRIQQSLILMKANFAFAKPTVELMNELSGREKVQSSSEDIKRVHQGFEATLEAKDLEFRHLDSSFRLRNVSFIARSGEFIGIVGSSGSGKSTLVDLMLGLSTPSSGHTLISHCEPMDAFSKWPGAVSYVPQEIPIINGSVRENLALGFQPEVAIDEFCWESLDKAKLADFVRSLPRGLDTQVGDRGTRLSGGQKQRLGIARALMSRPQILILDEATSSLDGVTELAISKELHSLKGSLTIIVVAHRLSTIVEADRIYFLDKGAVRGVGTFSELKNSEVQFAEQAKLLGL
jgi:ABC-type multidrug transport system fused ATPase/permease subunit